MARDRWRYRVIHGVYDAPVTRGLLNSSCERANASEPGARSGARGPRERASRGAPGGEAPRIRQSLIRFARYGPARSGQSRDRPPRRAHTRRPRLLRDDQLVVDGGRRGEHRAAAGRSASGAVSYARRSARSQPPGQRQEARRGRARWLRPRDVGAGSQRHRDRAGLSGSPAHAVRARAGDHLQPLARRRLQDRQAGVPRGAHLSSPRSVRKGVDRPRVRRYCASITGCSASAATRPSPTCSRRCCGRARYCGA